MTKEFLKDYHEHLRTVHFTLVLVCIASLIVSAAPGKQEVSAARQQLDEIWAITGAWNQRFLQSSVSDTPTEDLPSGPVRLTSRGRVWTALLDPNQPMAFVTVDQPPSGTHWRTDCDIDTPNQRGGRGILDPRKVATVIPQPETLSDFQHTWDSLLDGETLHEPEWDSDVYTIRTGASKNTVQAVELRHLSAPAVPALERHRLIIQCLVPSTSKAIRDNVKADVTAHYQLHTRIGNDEFYFPIYLRDSAVDGQSLLFKGRSEPWHHGYFKDSFRELSSASRGLENHSLRELVKVVAEEEVRSPSESLEAFGIKVPASLSLYGAYAIILCLQLYLWVQLHEMAKMGKSTQTADVAWIGSYRSLPARAIVMFSIVAGPISAVVAVSGRALLANARTWYSWFPLIAGLCLSTVLAIAAYQLIVKIVANARDY